MNGKRKTPVVFKIDRHIAFLSYYNYRDVKGKKKRAGRLTLLPDLPLVLVERVSAHLC